MNGNDVLVDYRRGGLRLAVETPATAALLAKCGANTLMATTRFSPGSCT